MRQTTYRTNDTLRAAVERGLERDGVGARGRSKWICSKIGNLIKGEPTLESVSAAEGLDDFPLFQSIQIDDETEALIEHAYLVIRSIDPRADGIQGALIRAAIRRAARGDGGGR
ncbi:MAG: hypothetical protein ABIW82_17105 [Dokdonella sp.]